MKNAQTVVPEELTGPGEEVPRAAEPPFAGTVQLKAERVEEKAALTGEGGAKVTFSLELSADPPQPLTIELADPHFTVMLHGALADAGQSA